MAFSKEKAHDRAERYAAKGQHDKAAREYQAIVEHDPKDVRAWLMLADCLVRCGDAPRAISRYLQVAGYYVEQRQPQKALAVYRQVLNLDQSRMDVQMKVAALNLKLGRIPDAVAVYERIAQAQMQAGQVDHGLSTYRTIADADPTAVSRRLRLAELYSRERRNKDAVEAFRLAGEQLLAGGRRPDYVRVAERLLYHDTNDRPTMRQLARVYLELGDARRALMKLNALLHADPSDREGIELLAETFMALGKVDKAVSVIGELAKELRKLGPGAVDDTKRVLRRGLQWKPGHESFIQALADLEGVDVPPAIAEPVPVEVEAIGSEEIEEVDADDLMELDEDDLVVEEAGAPAEIVPPTGSLTESVMSEADDDDVDTDSLTDFDKILFEARVYVKYRLFDHALDHVQQALEQEPDHLGALSLKARALAELGRPDDAADTHIQVARRVAASDPKLAREHISAALTLDNQHAEALRLQGAVVVEPARPPDEGDSGMFDVVVDGPAVGQALAGGPDSGDDFQIDVSDESEDEPERPPLEVENRFGVSESGPLPDEEQKTPPRGFVARAASRDQRTSGTPAAGFVPRPPSEAAATSGTPAAGFVVRLPEENADGRSEEIELDFDADLKPEIQAPIDVYDEESLPVRVDASASEPEPALELDLPPQPEPMLELEPEPEPEPEPAKAAGPVAPPGGWPDLSDDLAEVRFYRDQGLDDDAEAALADLRARHPGHPELTELDGTEGEADEEVAASVVSDQAAQPLVDVDDAEDDEDAYLAAIFGDPAPDKEDSAVGGELRGRVAAEQDLDPESAYDLGLAYREMGLVDDAIGQFEIAAKEGNLRSRALVMIGTLRVHRGETDRAVGELREAVELATTDDESSEANYELGLLYEKIGDTQAAVTQLQAVAAGFRDRDERLSQLMG